jgi:hypothetical protein
VNITANGSAMVSEGIKITEFPIEHGKILFVLSFSKTNRWRTFSKNTKTHYW